MSDYTAQHARAYRRILAAGGPASLVKGATTLPCAAMEAPGDPRMYEALGLVEKKPRSLWIAFPTYGPRVPAGAICTWAGTDYIVGPVSEVGPGGTPIMSLVVVFA
jgi:hypothetical protein